MSYHPGTLLMGLLKLGAPLVCGAAFTATLIVLRDDPDVYFVAGPYLPVGIAGYVSRKSRLASGFWLTVAVGITAIAAAILIGEGNVLAVKTAGHENYAGQGMAIGMAGLLQWLIVAISLPLGVVVWFLSDPRQAGLFVGQMLRVKDMTKAK